MRTKEPFTDANKNRKPKLGQFFGITALALTLNYSGDAFAHGHHANFICGDLEKGDLIKHIERNQDKILKKVNLSREQGNQLKQIRTEHMDKIFAQLQRVRGAHTEVLAVVEKNENDEVVRQRVSNLFKEKQALVNTKVNMALAIRSILNPDQRQQAIDEIKERIDDMCDD